MTQSISKSGNLPYTGYIKYDGLDNHLIDSVRNIPSNILKEFPTREDLVRETDSKLADATNAEIHAGQPIMFMPTDVDDETDKLGNYILNLYGCVASGDKAHVIITGCRPSFDILEQDDKDGDTIDETVRSVRLHKRIETLLSDRETKNHKIEDIYAKPFMGYCEKPKLFKRVSFNNHWDRLKAIDKIAKTETLKLFSDDKYNYYRKVARENSLGLSCWLELKEYKVLKFREQVWDEDLGNQLTGRISGCNSTFVISCDMGCASGNAGIKTYTGPKLTEEHIKKDRTLEIDWDAETYTSFRTGQLPMAEEHDDRFIEICMTVHWKSEMKPLMELCLITEESMIDPSPERFTIVCANQEALIKCFAHVVRALKPDVLGDFTARIMTGSSSVAKLNIWDYFRM